MNGTPLIYGEQHGGAAGVVAQRDSGKVAGHLYGVVPGRIVCMGGITLVCGDRPVTPVDDVAAGRSAHRDCNRVARRGRLPGCDKSIPNVGHNRIGRAAVRRGSLNYDQSHHPRMKRAVVRVFADLLKHVREHFPGHHKVDVEHPVGAVFGQHSAGNRVIYRVLVGPCDFTAHVYGDRMRNKALVGHRAFGHKRTRGVGNLGAGIGGECNRGCSRAGNGSQQHDCRYCRHTPQRKAPHHHQHKNVCIWGSVWTSPGRTGAAAPARTVKV